MDHSARNASDRSLHMSQRDLDPATVSASRHSRSTDQQYRQRSRARSRSPQRPQSGFADRESYRSRARSGRSRSEESQRNSAHSKRARHSPLPSPRRRRRSQSATRSPLTRSQQALPSQHDLYNSQRDKSSAEGASAAPKQKPNFKNTGLLAAETNRVTIGGGNNAESIVLKYHEPPEARKPPASEPWALYVFKGSSPDPLHSISLHTRSCWLIGRELAVVDIPVEHPSCSKQHAILQFRHITKKDEYGDKKSSVKLYLLDLESAHGTQLNGKKMEAARFVECFSGDVVRLGKSEREYVLLLPPRD